MNILNFPAVGVDVGHVVNLLRGYILKLYSLK